MSSRFFEHHDISRIGTLRAGKRWLRLSVVVPCSNEERILQESNRRLHEALGPLHLEFEIIYVDDGSTDATPYLLREFQAYDGRVRVVRLSRSFGREIAITAGLEHASGDVSAVIMPDLQDPPELIRKLVEMWREGYDVVEAVPSEMEGRARLRSSLMKSVCGILSRVSDIPISVDGGDFRLMGRNVVDALLAMPERDRFVRGMVKWLGFSQTEVPYRRESRSPGQPGLSPWKMLRLAVEGMVSFSVVPLRIATWTGFTSSALAIIGMIWIILEKLFATGVATLWPSGLIAVLFIGGIQLTCLGIIGEYVGRVYGEAKRRPLYFVEEKLGFESGARATAFDVYAGIAGSRS
jgi:polyisoprenyl-phosphate glycosyltransferase